MAITSVGYGGTVDYPDYGKGIVAPARYTLDRGNPFRPDRVTGGADRTVRLTGGTAQGYGIRDTESSASVDVQLDAVSSGHRWDEIVLRRDWSAETTTVTVIKGGTSKALPTRQQEPGVVDDQPIALARVQAGEQYVTDVVDLRCWAGDGGLVAVDTLSLSYLDIPGTRVNIGSTEYTRVLSAAGTASWDVKAPDDDTGWSEQPITNQGFSGTRRVRRIGTTAWFQAAGRRVSGASTGADLRLFTGLASSYRPTATAYGVAWVGSNAQRAYVTTGGDVHAEPFTINEGQTFQVFITWPVG